MRTQRMMIVLGVLAFLATACPSPPPADRCANLVPFADLSQCDLSGADLQNLDLTGANLTTADLSGADLRGATLAFATLYGADLLGADLSGANLVNADVYGANLVDVVLRGADLTNAYLAFSDLTRADLSDARLLFADLGGVTLTDAIFCNTMMPDGSINDDRCPATAVASRGGHTCALRAGGAVECWGRNDSGQLGNGTVATSPPFGSAVPVTVSGLDDAVAVSGGLVHTCALRAGGTVACWGRNTFGALGDGTTVDSSVPVAVTGLSGAVAIAAAGEHSCAVLADGTARCWGWNVNGALGDGNLGVDSPVPVPVVGLTDAVAITGGEAHTCAVLADTTVSCWGANGYGQLGNGTFTTTPPYGSDTAAPVPGLSGVTAITAGLWHTCALQAAGTVQCWGTSASPGGLGDGTGGGSAVPVEVSGLADATAVGAGFGHSSRCGAGERSTAGVTTRWVSWATAPTRTRSCPWRSPDSRAPPPSRWAAITRVR